MLSIPNGSRQTSWLFTSVTEELNSGLLRTNPAGSLGKDWTWGLQIEIAHVPLPPPPHPPPPQKKGNTTHLLGKLRTEFTSPILLQNPPAPGY